MQHQPPAPPPRHALDALVDVTTRRPRLSRLLSLVAVLVLGAACIVVFSIYARTMDEIRRDHRHIAERHAREVEYFMESRLDTAQAIADMGSSLLNEGSPPLPWVADALAPVPERYGFALNHDSAPPFTAGSSLTGLGPVPLTHDTLREMTMSLRLLILLREVFQRDNTTPWVYYTSERRFMLIHPAAPPSSFFFEDIVLELPFHTLARPDANPARAHYLTPPYLDTAGKGWMVTAGGPVYERDIFRGSLCIDISLRQLQGIASHHLKHDVRIVITTPKGELLADSAMEGDMSTHDSLLALPQHLSQAMADIRSQREVGVMHAGYTVFHVPLNDLGWHLLLTMPTRNIANDALFAALPVGGILVLLAVSIWLLYILAVALRTNRELSIRDSLTGLHNRRFFDEVLAMELARAARGERGFGLLIVDVDRFKEFNDTYGHAEGDLALQHLARVLVSSSRELVDMAYRLGGEEFAIIAHVDDALQLDDVARRVCAELRSLSLPHTASRSGILSVSIGGAMLQSGEVSTADTLYRRADTALYRAKQAGRDTHWIDGLTHPAPSL